MLRERYEMKNWLNYFEHNRCHRHAIPWERNIQLEPHLLVPLIRSLRKFQVGESGDGKHLRAQAAKTGDETYQQAIALFIREEQYHARLMARILERFATPLLERHWTDGCFIFLRRLFGLNHELLVLLMPEMIAKKYFRALRDATTDPLLRAVFAQILHDEEGHVAFHVDYLQVAFASLPLYARAALRVVWRIAFRAVCLVVLLDHGAILRNASVSFAAFWWDCGLIFDEVAAGIFSCARNPAIERLRFELKPESISGVKPI